MRRGLAVFLIYKTLVLALGLFAVAALTEGAHLSLGRFLARLFQWDAIHILRVAKDGYLAAEPSIQVFPAFPILIRAFHLLLPNWHWAALVATQACSFLAFYYFYRLARTELNETESKTAMVLFALFPSAYCLTAPYTEAAFCAAVFATAYYVRQNRFGWAALAGLVASSCRMAGMLLIPALVAHACLRGGRLGFRRIPKPQVLGLALAAAGVASGFIGYLVLNKLLQDQWFYFIDQQRAFFGVHFSWPFAGLVTAIRQWPQGSSEVLFMSVALLSLLPVVKRKMAFDSAYMAATVLLLVVLDPWLSRHRYVLPLYPVFIAWARWFTVSPLRLGLYGLGSMGLFGMYWTKYLFGGPIHP